MNTNTDRTAPMLLALLGKDTCLRKVATTCGGEWAGPCPRCGGRDRFRVQPYAEPYPRWTCRQCCTWWSNAPGYLMWRDGLTYPAACAALGIIRDGDTQAAATYVSTPPNELRPPPERWQWAAGRVVDICQRALWSSPLGDAARTYLHRRGFTDDTIRSAGLGFHVGGYHNRWNLWGLAPQPGKQGVWMPHGILIPWRVDGALWKLSVRLPQGGYHTITGSANVLYNADRLTPGCTAVVVEGAFDALALEQTADDLCVSVACGTTGARHMRWITKLALCGDMLIALDNEDQRNAAVARAAAYWLDVLQPRAVRWRPFVKDCGAMLEQRMDLRAWVASGIAYAHMRRKEHCVVTS